MIFAVVLGLKIIYCTCSQLVIHEHYLHCGQGPHSGEIGFSAITRLMCPAPGSPLWLYHSWLHNMHLSGVCLPLPRREAWRLGPQSSSRNADKDGCDKLWVVTIPHKHLILQPGLWSRDIKAQERSLGKSTQVPLSIKKKLKYSYFQCCVSLQVYSKVVQLCTYIHTYIYMLLHILFYYRLL